MRVYGIDFTSRPKRSKPLTCIECELQDSHLKVGELREWDSFSGFEEFLRCTGPWIAGIDFPFGQSRRFIKNIGWPLKWSDYVDQKVKRLDRKGFRKELDDYKRCRNWGDKEHLRATDKVAGSLSPQKQYGVPVAMMFFEGAPRLRDAGVKIPGLQGGDAKRIVVEAYPGVAVREIIGRNRSYKSEDKRKQSTERMEARKDILKCLLNGKDKEIYEIRVEVGKSLCKSFVDYPSGDKLDALICAVQAAWAWNNRCYNFGLPDHIDPTEGWIAHPF